MKNYVVEINEQIHVVSATHPTGDWAAHVVCEISDALKDKAFKIVEVDGKKEAVLDEMGEANRLATVAAQELKKEQEAEIQSMKRRFEVAHRVKAKIALINKSKAMSSAEILAYLQDPTIQAISQLISEISFGTAIQLLESSDLSAYYTQEEVDEVKQMLVDHINSEA